MFTASDATTRAFLIRVVAVTVCIAFLGSLGTVLFLAVIGSPVPPVLVAILGTFGGGGIAQLGAHSGSSNALNGVQVASQVIGHETKQP